MTRVCKCLGETDENRSAINITAAETSWLLSYARLTLALRHCPSSEPRQHRLSCRVESKASPRSAQTPQACKIPPPTEEQSAPNLADSFVPFGCVLSATPQCLSPTGRWQPVVIVGQLPALEKPGGQRLC